MTLNKTTTRLLSISCLLVGFLMSCQTTVEEITVLANQEDSLSVESATNIAIQYTDSGILKAVIKAPIMHHYPDAESPYLEMDSGVQAEFFSKDGIKQSWLTANYAINYEDKKVIILRNDVNVHNIKDEIISSEELIWDQAKKKISSDKFVKIRIRDEKVLHGEGFESNENFTKYKIKKLTGVIKLNEENEEDN